MKQLTQKLNLVLTALAAEGLVTNGLLHAYLGKLRVLLSEAEVSAAEYARFVDAVFDAMGQRESASGEVVAALLREKMESETCIGYYMPFGAPAKAVASWSESLPATERRGYDMHVERRASCLKTASFRAFGVRTNIDDKHKRDLTLEQVKSALRALRGDHEDFYGPEPPTGGRPALV